MTALFSIQQMTFNIIALHSHALPPSTKNVESEVYTLFCHMHAKHYILGKMFEDITKEQLL